MGLRVVQGENQPFFFICLLVFWTVNWRMPNKRPILSYKKGELNESRDIFSSETSSLGPRPRCGSRR
jgi:hypothetical protein